jgi:hypothetical protein
MLDRVADHSIPVGFGLGFRHELTLAAVGIWIFACLLYLSKLQARNKAPTNPVN